MSHISRSVFAVPSCFLFIVLNAGSVQAEDYLITALGRVEPDGGIIEIAGPSGSPAVISQLKVKEGDQVTKGQVLAILDSYAKRKADLERMEALLSNANTQLARFTRLSGSAVVSETNLDEAKLAVQTARADRAVAIAELGQARIKSPIAGQVLAIHSYPGERIGDNGLLEIGRTQTMYVVAEVYETDIGKVRAGQTATISSDALALTLTGKVERIGLKINKKDVFDTDPVAEADARVIETYILLDNSDAVARFTNLQVEVSIEP